MEGWKARVEKKLEKDETRMSVCPCQYESLKTLLKCLGLGVQQFRALIGVIQAHHFRPILNIFYLVHILCWFGEKRVTSVKR